MSFKKQTRLCVKCRQRFQQAILLRLQCIDNALSAYCGTGRSFYICAKCAEEPKTLQAIIKICKLKPSEAHSLRLKEIITLWKK